MSSRLQSGQQRPLLVVSACLTGCPCRYDGQSNTVPELARLHEQGLCLTVCPEVLGGLPIPRTPCEIRGQRVISRDGTDCTPQFVKGARLALRQALQQGLRVAVLKARSPSCGAGAVYDGTFSHTLRQGDGLFAAMLRREGFALYENDNWLPMGFTFDYYVPEDQVEYMGLLDACSLLVRALADAQRSSP